MDQKRKKTATFVVRVRDTGDKTWRGTIDWIDGGQTQEFRSTLELLNLIGGVVAPEGEREPGLPDAEENRRS